MLGFLGNLLGSAASYMAGGTQPTTPQGQWNIDNAGGAWPDSPAEVEKKRRQKLIEDRARSQQGMQPRGQQNQGQQNNQPQQQPQPQWQGQQSQAGPWQHPLAQAHFGAQNEMFAATNNAIQNEMDSRVQQASEERDRQHQYEMESLRQQGAMAQNQQAQQSAQQQNQSRMRRNAALLNMAGLGGHSVTGGGRNGVQVSPFGHIGKALLG